AHRQATTPRRAQILASTRERHPQLGQNLEREPPTLRLDQDSRPDLPTTQHISSTNSRRGTLGDRADPSFDRVARILRDALGVPVALVSLVERTRQVFPGSVGLPEPW